MVISDLPRDTSISVTSCHLFIATNHWFPRRRQLSIKAMSFLYAVIRTRRADQPHIHNKPVPPDGFGNSIKSLSGEFRSREEI